MVPGPGRDGGGGAEGHDGNCGGHGGVLRVCSVVFMPLCHDLTCRCAVWSRVFWRESIQSSSI